MPDERTAGIRLATPADGAALAAIYAPYVTNHVISFELEPPDAAEMIGRAERVMTLAPWLVCDYQGGPVGYAYAGIALPNPASEGFHRAMGFRPVGVYHEVGYKMGRWHDVGWYERALAARIADPPPPTPFAAMRDSPDLRSALRAGLPLLGARSASAGDGADALAGGGGSTRR